MQNLYFRTESLKIVTRGVHVRHVEKYVTLCYKKTKLRWCLAHSVQWLARRFGVLLEAVTIVCGLELPL